LSFDYCRSIRNFRYLSTEKFYTELGPLQNLITSLVPPSASSELSILTPNGSEMDPFNMSSAQSTAIFERLQHSSNNDGNDDILFCTRKKQQKNFIFRCYNSVSTTLTLVYPHRTIFSDARVGFTLNSQSCSTCPVFRSSKSSATFWTWNLSVLCLFTDAEAHDIFTKWVQSVLVDSFTCLSEDF